MTAVHHPGRLRPVRSPDAGVIDCAGARVSAHIRGPATVLVVEGEVDICNADRLAAAIRRLARPGNPFVLDLRSVDFMAVEGFRVLLAFADECHRAHVSWHVVAGPALRPLLRVFADHHLPVVGAAGLTAGSG
ncbi:STAS domain-containing protein [Mycolicibacterium neworleansense]|uniref:Stas domain-containing protein n=1 Tax=Mycolicibacterium neworleansense TaxID=146018 RepID=A0A0H5S7X7_9MYCO|nr:STAS domain-containing protein [Mycolicibacterium neworleansense]MCV7360042.1 STAS domain-containing protein [Mycolicibacterium neworleansense]CRZ17354.1 stas domain-containing protein [Mycolicibacterium neworleansense]